MPAPCVAPPPGLALSDVTSARGGRPHVQRLRQPGIGGGGGGFEVHCQGDLPWCALGVPARVFEGLAQTARAGFQGCVRKARHNGWVYAVVAAGGPMLVREGRRERIASPA